MNVQVVSLAPIPLVMIRHRGPYEGLSPEFDRLWAWVDAQGVPAGRTLGIYYDNPDFTAASQLRSAACVEVPATFTLGDRGGLPLEPGYVVAGSYATVRFVGPYEELAGVWTEFTTYLEKSMGRRIGDNAAFEVYVNDASTTAPSELITELYMPVL